MKKEVVKALQEQVNAEFYSAYLYFGMSSWADTNNLKGVANWLRVQAQEEQSHATFIHDFLLKRGEKSPMGTIEAPENEWEDIEAVFKQVLEHEQKVTAMIDNIADITLKAKDHATYQFIQQFVNEQIQEEETAKELLHKFSVAKTSPPLLYALDNELSTRVFTPSFTAKVVN